MYFYQKFSLVLALLAGIFIFYISSLSFPPNPLPGFSYTSLIYHFGIFFLFSFFLLFGIIGNGKIVKIEALLALVIAVVYAGLDELHQYYVPGRACTIFDFATDVTGCLIGGLAVLLIGIFYTGRK